MVSNSFLTGAAGAALLIGSIGIGSATAMPPGPTTAQSEVGSKLVHQAQSRRERERERERRERERGGRCLDRVSATGGQRATERGARGTAARAWQDRVRSKYGEKYMDLVNARDVDYECTQSARALGVKIRRCELRAIPCQPKAN